jgi:hypothetical protein
LIIDHSGPLTYYLGSKEHIVGCPFANLLPRRIYNLKKLFELSN